jgi:hypothetical protein
LQGYADDLWGIADAMGWDTSVEEKWFTLGFWVLVGINAGALLLSLFTSGKLLEGMVSSLSLLNLVYLETALLLY